MEKYFRIAAGIIGFILVLLSVIGMNAELADSDSVETMLPPCDLDEGMPWPGDEELICYWGMSVEVLEIPAEAIAADVIVDISWDKQDVWIGIADADQISNCDLDDIDENTCWWKGHQYRGTFEDTESKDYWNAPWEVEARQVGEELRKDYYQI